jgi:hypothetical protein
MTPTPQGDRSRSQTQEDCVAGDVDQFKAYMQSCST